VIVVRALGKAAGVSKRSMYRLFDSKDELLAASLDSPPGPSLTRTASAAASSSRPTSTPGVRLRRASAAPALLM
jgi:AcrR family transcriptional regulator